MPTPFIENEVCATCPERSRLGASVAEGTVSDALSVDIRESCERGLCKHRSSLKVADNLTEGCHNWRNEAGPLMSTTEELLHRQNGLRANLRHVTASRRD